MLGQVELLDYLDNIGIKEPVEWEQPEKLPELLHKGEHIYRTVAGEVEEWDVDGSFIVNKEYRGYWLSNGIHSVVHDKNIGVDVFKTREDAERLAKSNLSKCKTIVLDGITEYRKWEWVRELDNYLMTAEIGIIENYVFVHDWYCYCFAYPFSDERQKKKIMKDSIDKITHGYNAEHMNYKEIETDGYADLGKRLYWSKSKKCYADYRYTNYNG